MPVVEPAEPATSDDPTPLAAAGPPRSFDEAFDDLFAAGYRAAFRLLGDRDEASDCAQEALTRAYPRWDRLVRRGDPTPWVVRVAANLAIDRWRRQQRQHAEPIEPAGGHDDLVANRSMLHDALAQLPKRQREVVVLRYVGDLSEAQTATALGISPGAVKQHTSRGLAALRAYLEEH